MLKKLIGILVCTLLIATAIFSVTGNTITGGCNRSIEMVDSTSNVGQYTSSVLDLNKNTDISYDDIVWDNNMNFYYLLTAQDANFPGNQDGYAADDFQFQDNTLVCGVHWIGGFIGADYDTTAVSWCIEFYIDDGTGNVPSTLYCNPYHFTFNDLNPIVIQTSLNSKIYEFSADFTDNLGCCYFYGLQKYWIVIYAEGISTVEVNAYWGSHTSPIILNEAVYKSPSQSQPGWTNTYNYFGIPLDMCFQLTAHPCYGVSINIPSQSGWNVGIKAILTNNCNNVLSSINWAISQTSISVFPSSASGPTGGADNDMVNILVSPNAVNILSNTIMPGSSFFGFAKIRIDVNADLATPITKDGYVFWIFTSTYLYVS